MDVRMVRHDAVRGTIRSYVWFTFRRQTPEDTMSYGSHLIQSLALLFLGAPQDAPVPVEEIVRSAAEIGLTPESLVLAGMETSAATLLLRVQDATTEREKLAESQSLASAAADLLAQCSMSLQANPDDATAVQQFEQAAASLQAARSDVELERQALRNAVLFDATAPEIEALEHWRSSAPFRIAAEFRVLAKDDMEWQLIEAALRAEQRALLRDEAIDPVYADALEDLRDEPAVISAAQALSESLDATEAAFTGFDGA